MDSNICKFVPLNRNNDKIDIINFVYETEKHKSEKISTVYSMNLVIGGEGSFILCTDRYKLKKGDIFFVFPSVNYSIVSEDNLKYIYISYIGIRSNKIMDKFNITKTNPYFEGYDNLIDFWIGSVSNAHSGNVDMLSESVLLYTFSVIGNSFADAEYNRNNNDMILRIKNYIDENFSDYKISLKEISMKYSYNEKYISTAFKKEMKTGFKQYLNTLRIQKACALMSEGLTCIKDIAWICGFKDQMYFSKVFKKKMGVTPSEHIIFINKCKKIQ